MADSIFSESLPPRSELVLRNTVTPRIFVAATRMDDGKTTMSIGLFAALQHRFPRIGFIKPVGQRFVEIEGAKIDEDTARRIKGSKNNGSRKERAERYGVTLSTVANIDEGKSWKHIVV